MSDDAAAARVPDARTPHPHLATFDGLKKAAKRWLKALRLPAALAPQQMETVDG